MFYEFQLVIFLKGVGELSIRVYRKMLEDFIVIGKTVTKKMKKKMSIENVAGFFFSKIDFFHFL